MPSSRNANTCCLRKSTSSGAGSFKFPKVDERELEEVIGLDNLINKDVGAAVEDFRAAGLELLYVADVGIPGALADGKDAVEVVVQALAAGKVVLGDGAGKVALGRVGDDKHRPAPSLFQGHPLDQETSRINALVRGVAQVANVVDDEGTATFLFGNFLYLGEELLLIMLRIEGGGVDFRTEEACRKAVLLPGDLAGVT